ncbi:phosphoglucomutase 1 [Sistotremastrum niveocremeum HHB9708]|uniref:Phosphoglucomutase 1 n=1 Tax=Sistotremastrum niveocremeum HHB9708 TaxID=1314777 RepID=A0A164QQK0_9AGAM|nr:phosphoglucomutase 1 [Sistotremastrum niveocremeum HHB9708]
MSELELKVKEWLILDRNETTNAEIRRLWENKEYSELQKRMNTRIEFGTAGLRGKMEAGWARMNDLIVIQASQGLCEYVLRNVSDARKRGIVIGHDHRHNSKKWAHITANVFFNRGLKVYLHAGLVHTPLVPFSVSKLGAACGVMITASHNPKHDNGFKVYWENAVQIIAPHDTGIASAISENLEPKITVWGEDPSISSSFLNCTDDMIKAYYEDLQCLSVSRTSNNLHPPIFVSTAMHGVGDRFAAKAFDTFGIEPYVPVLEQKDPDPEFPTVSFPNPEEKGLIDLDTASNEIGAAVVLAQDPDADRFAAAEKRQASSWFTFSGDQLGALFAARILEQYKNSGRPINRLAMVASTVSSKLIQKMALVEGFHFSECLTGFKYIGNTALDLEGTGSFDVMFGYEEAIGFMFGKTIRDKDGVAATACFAEMIISLYSQGLTAQKYLQSIYQKYGYFQTKNSYVVCQDPTLTAQIFERLRHYPVSSKTPRILGYPPAIANLDIVGVRDLTVGHAYDSSIPSREPVLPLSSGNMVTFKANGRDKSSPQSITLTLRTSGTEPKIKYYLEGQGPDASEIKALLDDVVKVLLTDWLEVDKHMLQVP